METVDPVLMPLKYCFQLALELELIFESQTEISLIGIELGRRICSRLITFYRLLSDPPHTDQ